MTAILAAIWLSLHHQGDDDARDARDARDVKNKTLAPLVFVQGLSDAEQEFIRENRSQLGSGKAKHIWDAIVQDWKLFRSLPIVLQLLVGVTLVLIVIFAPFVGDVILKAIMSPDVRAAARMMVAMGGWLVLAIGILMILILM